MTSSSEMFNEVEAAFDDCEVAAGGRSRAPLLWLLTRLFQVDVANAQDAICDEENDKGIDALYVDDVDTVIVVIQSKRKDSEPPTAGDHEIKKLVGSMQQLATAEGVGELYATGNADLRMLIDRLEIRRLVEEGYTTRGAFITNAARDHNTDSYLRSVEGTVDLDLYDRAEVFRILSHIRGPSSWLGRQRFVLGAETLLSTRSPTT